MNWKDITPRKLTDDYKIKPPSPKRVNGHPKPKRDNMFKRIWSKVKTTAVDKVAPYVLNNLDFDFNVDKDPNKDYVVASVYISFHGKKVYGRQKTIKI